MHSLNYQPIGHINSCYQEKFGIPRQPGLVTAAKSQLILCDLFGEESVRGLEGFSHLWLQFVFHQTQQQGWKPMVRPPRLGGNKKVGVFATRSTFRPNPIGLSVVKLDRIEVLNSNVILHLSGCDLLNETPILDIKPYLPYVDNINDAIGGFANEKPESLFEVTFSTLARSECKDASVRLGEDIVTLITQILELDPKPSFHQSQLDQDRIYKMKLHDFDLSWQYCENNKIKVLSISS